MSTAIWWIRRDLRLRDNLALHEARTHAENVVPVFILDDKLLKSGSIGEKRLAFLFAGLRKLDEDLHTHGSRLILRSGSPVEVLAKLVDECKAALITAEADYSPYAQSRDMNVSRSTPLRLVGSSAILPPDSVLKQDGSPYTKFTPYSKSWKANLPIDQAMLLPAPKEIKTSFALPSDKIPELPALAKDTAFQSGEAAALSRLNEFFEGRISSPIYKYDISRNLMNPVGTSMLSPYIRFGMLSPRRAAALGIQAIEDAPDAFSRKGAESWLDELIWRDFYIQILYHFPIVKEENFRMKGIGWDNNEDNFTAWKTGCTGYPVIDAAMRQLLDDGWMHNRARMIVASFLTKDLLIDWRWGERWFMQQLIDGDPASNNGGWQWSAGTGTDAAPYFRIFNPITQSRKYDPHGENIRRWVPALRSVPEEFIHQPWMMSLDTQIKYGCRIGLDYPAPIIDHRWAHQRALDVYRKARMLNK